MPFFGITVSHPHSESNENDSIDVVQETVNRLLGYEELSWPQGLWWVSDDRPTERIVLKFDV